MAEVTNVEANELADDILLREEFLGARGPGFFERNVNRGFNALGDFLEWLFGSIFGAAGGGAGSGFAIVLAALAIVLLGVAIFRAIRGRTPKEVTDDDDGSRIVFDEVVDARGLRLDLNVATESKRWRSAVIASFRLAIIGLIDAGHARERPSATTGDFGSDISTNRPDLIVDYDRAARIFERAFYSDLPIEEADFEIVEQFRNIVPGESVTAGRSQRAKEMS